MKSESKNIIQMLKNVKQIIDVSKERNCWEDEELKNIEITYHNVCEIVKQLEQKDKDNKKLEELDAHQILQEPEPEPEQVVNKSIEDTENDKNNKSIKTTEKVN